MRIYQNITNNRWGPDFTTCLLSQCAFSRANSWMVGLLPQIDVFVQESYGSLATIHTDTQNETGMGQTCLDNVDILLIYRSQRVEKSPHLCIRLIFQWRAWWCGARWQRLQGMAMLRWESQSITFTFRLAEIVAMTRQNHLGQFLQLPPWFRSELPVISQANHPCWLEWWLSKLKQAIFFAGSPRIHPDGRVFLPKPSASEFPNLGFPTNSSQIWVSHLFPPGKSGKQMEVHPGSRQWEKQSSPPLIQPLPPSKWTMDGFQKRLAWTWKNVNGHGPKRKIIFRGSSTWGTYCFCTETSSCYEHGSKLGFVADLFCFDDPRDRNWLISLVHMSLTCGIIIYT